MGKVSARGQLLVVGLHGVLGLAVLVAATVLSALHDPISSTLASLFGIILGLAGAGSAAVSAVGTAMNGKTPVSPQMLADTNLVLREAIDHLAGARAQLPSTAPPAPAFTSPSPPAA